MPVSGVRLNLLGQDRESMEAFFTDLGEPAYRAHQVMKWLYHLGVRDVHCMTNLSKALRTRLADTTKIAVPEVASDQVSADGTRKWLFALEDGNCVETVFIPDGYRGTLCVSSQVGCPLDCAFCVTAQQGFNRNLSAAEIVAQVWLANERLGADTADGLWPGVNDSRLITNVVFMGMGEPLLNVDNVVRATRLLMDDLGFGLSKRRVTLSTAGVVPALDRLASLTDISLAVSLHAVSDELRSRLVPINRKYPIRELLEACRRFIAKDRRRRITFEYIMLAGLNDGDEDARRLARLLRGIPAKINLIPFNPYPGAPYHASPSRRIDEFREVLIAAGLMTITRKPRGQDIDAACGQLAGRVRARVPRRAQAPVVELHA